MIEPPITGTKEFREKKLHLYRIWYEELPDEEKRFWDEENLRVKRQIKAAPRVESSSEGFSRHELTKIDWSST